jgi:hypothetical protein
MVSSKANRSGISQWDWIFDFRSIIEVPIAIGIRFIINLTICEVFFITPALVILIIACCVTHLYCDNSIQIFLTHRFNFASNVDNWTE